MITIEINNVVAKDLIYLPSSHSGGVVPGNQTGLSGGSGSQTLETPFAAFRRLPPPLASTESLPTFPVILCLGTSLFIQQT